MLALEVTPPTALPEVLRGAVVLVSIAVVDVDALGGVEGAATAGAVPAATLLVGAFPVSVSG